MMDNPSHRRERLIPDMNRTALLAMGAVGVAATGQANADVMYTAVNTTISSDGPTTSVRLDVPDTNVPDLNIYDNKGFMELSADATNGIRGTKPSAPETGAGFFTDDVNSSELITNLTAFEAGDEISLTAPKYSNISSNTYDVSLTNADGSVSDFSVGAGEQFIGWRLISGGINYFGWIGVDVLSVGDTVSAHISGYAIERSPETPIIAGDFVSVPEPSSLALLALGSTGLLGIRKRKADQAIA